MYSEYKRELGIDSKEELFAIDTITWLVNELILSLLLVQCTQLQRMQLQCETRPDLFERACLAIISELVAMLSEEDKVSLIV